VWARKAVARWFSRNPTVRVGGVAAAVALAVSGLFGGLEPAQLTDRLDEVEPNTPVTLDPFTLTLKQAIALDELEGAVAARTPGSHLMVVLVDAENRSDTSLGAYLLAPAPRAESFMNRNLVVLDDRLAPQAASVYDADSDLTGG
jgi:hypothetical protein